MECDGPAKINFTKGGDGDQTRGRSYSMSVVQKPSVMKLPAIKKKTRATVNNAWGDKTYAELIAEAIGSTPSKKMRLNDIYLYFCNHYEWFKDKRNDGSSAGWKNSIRHNLSLHDCFFRCDFGETSSGTCGTSAYWGIKADIPVGQSSRKSKTKSIADPEKKKKSILKKMGKKAKKLVKNVFNSKKNEISTGDVKCETMNQASTPYIFSDQPLGVANHNFCDQTQSLNNLNYSDQSLASTNYAYSEQSIDSTSYTSTIFGDGESLSYEFMDSLPDIRQRASTWTGANFQQADIPMESLRFKAPVLPPPMTNIKSQVNWSSNGSLAHPAVQRLRATSESQASLILPTPPQEQAPHSSMTHMRTCMVPIPSPSPVIEPNSSPSSIVYARSLIPLSSPSPIISPAGYDNNEIFQSNVSWHSPLPVHELNNININTSIDQTTDMESMNQFLPNIQGLSELDVPHELPQSFSFIGDNANSMQTNMLINEQQNSLIRVKSFSNAFNSFEEATSFLQTNLPMEQQQQSYITNVNSYPDCNSLDEVLEVIQKHEKEDQKVSKGLQNFGVGLSIKN